MQLLGLVISAIGRRSGFVARLSTLYKSDGYAANADVTRMVGLRSLQTGGEFAKGETLLQAKCRGSAISSRYQCE